MTGITRRHAIVSGAGAATMLATGACFAQAWPNKPLRWVVPYTAAGITDTTTRLVAERLSTILGQQIVIDNRPGANSMIGADIVAKAPPDGYTLLTVIAGHSANATLYAGRMTFDAVKSFEPVSLMGVAPVILVANNDLPAKDVKEFIAYAKANPGKVSYGSSGVGAAAHLTSELIKQVTGIQMEHVPYRGTAPALQDLMGGNIQVLIDVPSSMMPHVNAGKIKALGMLSKARLPAAPNVPTIVEAGGPDIEASTWMMALAPAGTPKAIVDRLSQEIAKLVTGPDLKPRFEALGIIPGGYTPENTGKFLQDEIARWKKVIETAGVKPEG
jgi:tripartite-type tricarboxylate transporter receptor subunit TctC